MLGRSPSGNGAVETQITTHGHLVVINCEKRLVRRGIDLWRALFVFRNTEEAECAASAASKGVDVTDLVKDATCVVFDPRPKGGEGIEVIGDQTALPPQLRDGGLIASLNEPNLTGPRGAVPRALVPGAVAWLNTVPSREPLPPAYVTGWYCSIVIRGGTPLAVVECRGLGPRISLARLLDAKALPLASDLSGDNVGELTLHTIQNRDLAPPHLPRLYVSPKTSKDRSWLLAA